MTEPFKNILREGYYQAATGTTMYLTWKNGLRYTLIPGMHISYLNPDTQSVEHSTIFEDKKLLYVRSGHEVGQVDVLVRLDTYYGDEEEERTECWVNRTKRKLKLLVD